MLYATLLALSTGLMRPRRPGSNALLLPGLSRENSCIRPVGKDKCQERTDWMTSKIDGGTNQDPELLDAFLGFDFFHFHILNTFKFYFDPSDNSSLGC